MGAAVALGNVISKTQDLFVVAAVPLHRNFHTDVGVLVALAIAHGVEDVGVQHRLAFVDEVNEAFNTTSAREVVFFAGTLVFEANTHAVVQEAEFAQTLAQDFVVEIIVLFEDVGVGQKVNFGSALFGVPGYFHRRDFYAVLHLNNAVLNKTFAELHNVHFAVAANGQAQHFGQGVHAAHAHAVQTARYFVTILVELAACVQLGQRNFSRTALGLVLVIHLDARRDATAIVNHADGVVRVDGDQNIIAVAC